MKMNTETAAAQDLDQLLGQVATEFFERLARGETPNIDEYAQRHPEIAHMIRQALPALQIVSDSMADASSSAQPLGEKHEKRLGDFRILHELGRGGMGVVYEAEQISMGGRKVALKVLPFAAMVDEKRLQRFRNEVRAAASLDHPNIVSVYSVGEERGVHFYAMQLIRGQSLAEVIHQLRELRRQQHPLSATSLSDVISASANGQPCSAGNDATQEFRSGSQEASDQSDASAIFRSPTSDTVPGAQGVISTKGNPRRSEYFRSVAELGIQAAEALDHAHQQGVIHRDIKPANLMIDAHAKLYITDFGLAQMEENAGITMTGDLIGTLRYMSPEQALGKRVAIDHRADIYALGVSLYELLTTEPAYDGENRAALIKQVAFQELRRLRQIDRTIPHDLETIVHKAVAKNPDERYSSAQDLANDLKAFRDNQPITARPPSVVDRSRKWAYRNQGLVLAIAVVMLLTTIGLATSSLLLAQQRNVAERLRQQALAEAARADQEAEKAKTEAAVAAAVIEFINTDLLGAADPNAEPNRELTVRELLDRASKNIEKRFQDQPLVAAAIQRTLGNTAFALGEYEQAERHLNAAKLMYQQQLKNEHLDSLRIDTDLAKIYSARGEYARSKELNQSVLVRSSRTRGTQDAITLNARAAIANIDREEGSYQDAEKLLREVLDTQRRVLGPEHFDTLGTMMNLANAIAQLGRPDEAEQLYQELIDIRRRLLGPEHPETLRTMMNLANAIVAQERFAKGEQLYREVLDVQRRVLGPEHPQTLATMSNLSNTMSDLGRYAEAEQLKREVLEIQRSVLGPEHPKTLLTMMNLAYTICELGRLSEAEQLDRELLEIQRRVLGRGHPETLMTMLNLANAIAQLGRFAEAEQCFRELFEINLRIHGPEHPKTLSTMTSLANTIDSQRKFAESEKLYREVLEIQRRVLGLEHLGTLITMSNLPLAISGQGRHVEAEQLFREVLEIQRRVLGPENPQTLATIGNLANTIKDLGRYAESEQFNREVLEIQRGVLGPEHPSTLMTMSNLAVSIGAQRLHAEEVKLNREVLEIRRRVLGPEHPDTLDSMNNLAFAIGQLGGYAEAEQLYREFLDVSRRVLGPEHPKTLISLRARTLIVSNWSWALATDADPGRRDPEKAVELACEATQLQPDVANYWNILGVARYRAGQWQASVESLEKADSMIPAGDREHRMFLAMAHWQLGEKQRAKESYSQSAAWIAANKPNDAEQQRFRSEAEELFGLTEQGRNKLIAEYYAQTDIQDPKALAQRGKWYRSIQDYAKAIDDFSAAIALEPDSTSEVIWRERGICYFALEQYPNALADFNRSVELKPTAVWSLKERGRVYQRLGQLDLALADLNLCIKLKPTGLAERQNYLQRASIYRDSGEYELALADAQTGIDLEPKQDSAGFALATAYALRGDIYAVNLQQYQLATDEYTKVITLDPLQAEVFEKRGQAYQQLGDTERAAADLAEAKRLKETVIPPESDATTTGDKVVSSPAT